MALISRSATAGKFATQAFEGVSVVFAIVICGEAIVTEGSSCTALTVGQGHVFCPTQSMRIEVEGASSLVLVYSCAIPQAVWKAEKGKRLAAELLEVVEAARHTWFCSRCLMRKRRQPLVGDGQVEAQSLGEQQPSKREKKYSLEFPAESLLEEGQVQAQSLGEQPPSQRDKKAESLEGDNPGQAHSLCGQPSD